jgi:hypothetical protein
MFCRLLCPPLWLRFFDLAILPTNIYIKERKKKKKRVLNLRYFFILEKSVTSCSNKDKAIESPSYHSLAVSYVTFFTFFFMYNQRRQQLQAQILQPDDIDTPQYGTASVDTSVKPTTTTVITASTQIPNFVSLKQVELDISKERGLYNI